MLILMKMKRISIKT